MLSKGTLFIVSAPSGAGKSSLIKALLDRFNGDDLMRLSVSHTTRAPRVGEKDGISYHFVSKDIFEELIQRNAFYEYASVFNNYYGTSREIVENWLNEGKDVLLDIDWQGARNIRNITKNTKSIFIIPPSLETLEARLRTRGQDSEEVIINRMKLAKREISHYKEYDYVIFNDNFEIALMELRSIIIANRCIKDKQENTLKAELDEMLDGLNEEI